MSPTKDRSRQLANVSACGAAGWPASPELNGAESSAVMVARGSGPTVCQLVHGLPVGGAEVLVDRIIRSLCDRFRFVVACLDEVGQLGELLTADGIRVERLGRRPGFDWRCIRRLQRLFTDEHVQLVHAHQYTPFAYALATRLFGRRPPVMFTEHGRFFPDYPSRKRKWFNRLLAEPRDRFTAVGQSVRQALIENEGLPAERLQIVHNGIDLRSWEADAAHRAVTRRELGIVENEFLVIQVARLDPIKDHATAIRAVCIAARKNPRIRLLIVGDGPQRTFLEQVIGRQGSGDRVIMLGMRNDVRRLLAAADAFLLTSVSEGIPVTVLEAMAAGVPVVATNVGGLPELVTDGESGFLAPAGDAPRLAELLIKLADDPALRTTLADRAKNRAALDFSEARMLGSYEQIYREMLPCCAVAGRHTENGRQC